MKATSSSFTSVRSTCRISWKRFAAPRLTSPRPRLSRCDSTPQVLSPYLRRKLRLSPRRFARRRSSGACQSFGLTSVGSVARVGRFSRPPREGADAFTSIRAVGDEIDEVAAAHVAVTLEKCTNLRSLCLARNPMGDAGAVALAPGLAACASLTALTVSRCGIGDAGAAAVARALPSTLIALDASSNEMTSLGLGHLAAELRAGRTPSLTRLNLSGNDVGPGEVPNSPRRCRRVRRNSKHWIFADVFSPIPGSDGLHRHCRSASASRRYISAATARETRRRRRLPLRSQTVRDWRSSAWR